MHNPLTIPSDISPDSFDTNDKFVQWEQRQPAEVSWWVGCPDLLFHDLMLAQQARMATSPFARVIVRSLEQS